MKRLSPFFLLVYLLLIPVADAQSLGETTRGWEAQSEGKELTFLAFFFSRAELSNIYPENGMLNGQLIGRLFGPNTSTTTAEDRSLFFEQRIIPFFVYEPQILDGFALLRASFELDWTWGDVWHYIATHDLPYNPLHDEFMPSIGCAPCTRAIAVGEPFRAGRWWWEDEGAKECGLHVRQQSDLVSAQAHVGEADVKPEGRAEAKTSLGAPR